VCERVLDEVVNLATAEPGEPTNLVHDDGVDVAVLDVGPKVAVGVGVVGRGTRHHIDIALDVGTGILVLGEVGELVELSRRVLLARRDAGVNGDVLHTSRSVARSI